MRNSWDPWCLMMVGVGIKVSNCINRLNWIYLVVILYIATQVVRVDSIVKGVGKTFSGAFRNTNCHNFLILVWICIIRLPCVKANGFTIHIIFFKDTWRMLCLVACFIFTINVEYLCYIIFIKLQKWWYLIGRLSFFHCIKF